MAATPEAGGIPYKCGLIIGATWGTPAAVNAANMGFRPIQWDFTENKPPLGDASYNADAHDRQRAETGNYNISGSYTVQVKYQGLDLHFALAMGATFSFAGATEKTGKYTRVNALQGPFGTLGWYNGIDTVIVQSIKYKKLTISAGPSEFVEAKFEWVGNKGVRTTGDDLGSVTEPAGIDMVQSINSVLDYQTDAQGGTLADVAINSWEVVFERDLDVAGSYASDTTPYPREFTAGMMKTTGKMQVPYEVKDRFAAALAGTPYEFKLNHALVTTEKEFGIWLPHFKVVTPVGANPSSKNRIPMDLTFMCDYATTAPSWTTPVVPHIQFINSTAADPLP